MVTEWGVRKVEFSLASASFQVCAWALVTHGSLSFLNYKTETITQDCGEDPKRECLSCACLSKDWVPKSQNLSPGRTLNIKPAPRNRGGKCLSLFSISLSLSVSDLKLHFSLQSALSSSFRLASPTVCLLPQPPPNNSNKLGCQDTDSRPNWT